MALQRLDGFLHLDRVADRAAQRDIHPGQQRPGTHAVLLAQGDHRLGELARPLVLVMNAPLPTLTSRTSALVPSAIFLDMIELAISGMDSTVPVTSRSA